MLVLSRQRLYFFFRGSRVALMLLLLLGAMEVKAQVTFFSENAGTPAATTGVNTYTGWQNTAPVVFSGTADVRTTSPSTGAYLNASGNGNVFFTNTLNKDLTISGINSSAYTAISISLGHYKSNTTGSTELLIEVSSDGINFSSLSYTRPPGTGTANWILINPTGTIPSATNLRIRFTQNSTATQFRIDDIKLSGMPACSTPNLQASNITSPVSGFQNLNIQWANGNGNGRVVCINTVNSFADPVNGTDPPANAYYNGTGQQVIYNGSGNSVNVTGLDPCQGYWFRVYEFNCSGIDILFNTSLSAGNPANISTSSISPSGLTLASENFEGASTWNYNYSCLNTGTGGSGSGIVAIKPSPFGYLTSKALVKSHTIDNSSAELLSEATIDFTQVAIPSGASNIRFSFRLASLNATGTTTGSSGPGHDNNDSISLYIQINGSGSFSQTFKQNGFNNKLFDYLPEKSNSLDWNQNVQLINPSNDFNYFIITIPDGSTSINIRFVERNNRTDENWSIDNLLLTVDMPSASTLPLLFSITGDPTFCAGSTGSIIGLTGSQTGMNYQLFLNGTAVGLSVPGTGNAIDFGYHAATGLYTVVATNLTYTHCKSDMLNPLTLSIKPSPAITNIVTTPASCGLDNGSITITASGGTPAYQYSIDNGGSWQGSAFFSLLPAGTYYARVKDANCESLATSATVTLSGTTLSASATHQNVSCFNGNNGTATISASGGTGTLTYKWNTSPVQNTATAVNLIAGTYICTITDGVLCSIDITVEITQPSSELTAGIISRTEVECYGFATGSAEVNGSGGTGPYTYSWNTTPVQNGSVITNLPAGSYICTVTDNNGCFVQVPVIILQPAAVLTASISAYGDVTCFGGNNGNASVNVSGGTTSYAYEWNTVPAQYTASASNLIAGLYSCLVTDAHGCTTTASVNITQPAQLIGSILSQTGFICSGTSNGSATVEANGGSPGYSFLWNTSPPQNSATAINLSEGSHTCTITDSKGCTTDVDVVIAAYPPPSIAVAGNQQTVCGFSTVLNANQPTIGTGLWTQVSGPLTLTIIDPLNWASTATTTAPGTFGLQWTITNEPSCPTSSDVVLIEFGNAITVTAGNNSPLCTGDTIRLTSSIAGATYSWTSTNGFTSSDPNPLIPNSSPADNGTYTVTVTNIPGGCPTTSNSTVVNVTNPPVTPPITSQNVSGNSQDVCVGSQVPYIIQFPTTGSFYHWTLSGGGSINYPDSSEMQINWATAGGPYELSVTETSASGCIGVPVILNIIVNSISAASVLISPDNNPVCTGTTVTYTATPVNGGISPQFTWFVNGIQRPNPGPSAFSYIPADGDKVYAVLNSSSPCALPNPVLSEADTMHVTGTVAPSISITASAISLCTGDGATITASALNGGSAPVYEWYLNGTQQAGQPTDMFAFVPGDGDAVFAKVLSNLGCASPAQAVSTAITFNVSAALAVGLSISQQAVLCHTDPVLLNAAPANQGAAPVYEWYLNNSLVAGQQAASYSGMFNDGDKIFAKVISSLTCATGNPAQSNDIFITRPALLEITQVDPVNESCGLHNGSITLTVNGGTGLKQYSIETPPKWESNPVFDSLTASIVYNILVKDDNGCLASKGIYQITSIPGPEILPAGSGSYCEGSAVELSASSATVLVYEWMQPDGNTISTDTLTITSASAIDSGLYQVIGKDLLTGCSDTAWLAVNINKLPEVSFGLPPTLCSGTEQILSPGHQYASYLWQDGSAAPTFPAVDMGTYFVLATDSAGCSGSDTLELIPCSQVFFPNAFSPDRNGKNESFRPVTGGIVLLDYKMIIYNRWGQLIYQSNDYITGWDGTFNGAAAPNGIYPYLITYRIADPASPGLSKVSKFRGTVLLVK